MHAHHPDNYKDFIRAEINSLSPDSLTRLLRGANNATEDSHYVITTEPLPGDRSKPYRTFASPYSLEECYKLLFVDRVDAARKQYNILRGDPTTSTAAGVVFEHWAHQFLWKQGLITLFPIYGRFYTQGKKSNNAILYDNHQATNKKKVNMPNLEEYVVINKTQREVKYGTYYHPKHRSFPTVDSWVLIQQGLRKPPIFIVRADLKSNRLVTKRCPLLPWNSGVAAGVLVGPD